MTTREIKMTLEAFSDDISANVSFLDDDDVILASQAQRFHEKRTKVKGAYITNNLEEPLPHLNYKSDVMHLSNNAVLKNKVGSDAFKNTQEDIFASSTSSITDQSILKVSKTICKKITEKLKENSFYDKTELINSALNHEFESEHFEDGNLRIKQDNYRCQKSSLDVPFLEESLICDFGSISKNILKSNNASQTIVIDDDAISKDEDENLTSDVILQTKPKNYSEYAQEYKNEQDQYSCMKSDSSSLYEAKTITLNLSVSCQVVFCANTNKIIEKSILNVNDFQRSLELCCDHKFDKLRKSSIEDDIGCSKSKIFAQWPAVKKTKSESSSSAQSDTIPISGIQESLIEEVSCKLQWINENLLPAKLDELVQKSLKNPIGKTDEIHSMRKNESFGTKKSCDDENIKIDEDMDLFPSGRPASQRNLILGSTLPLPLLEKNISCRDESNSQEKMSIIEEAETPLKIFNLNSSSTEKKNDNFYKRQWQNNERDVFEAADEGNESQSKDERENKKRKIKDSGRRIRLEEGQLVLAAANPLRCYRPGRLIMNKANAWQVEFHNKNLEMVCEEEIVPWEWLQTGDLVSVLSNSNYLPGKIKNIEFGNDTIYEVELDEGNRQIKVDKTSLSLTEVMADILKERFSYLRPKMSPNKMTAKPGGSRRSLISEINKSCLWKNKINDDSIMRRKKNLKAEPKNSSLLTSNKRKPRKGVQGRKKNLKNKKRRAHRSTLRLFGISALNNPQ